MKKQYLRRVCCTALLCVWAFAMHGCASQQKSADTSNVQPGDYQQAPPQPPVENQVAPRKP